MLKARVGDLAAYGEIVKRYQDMAVGYAFSILGDFHLSEDAAQEAFVEAFRCLPSLREPDAFASWFRRIIFKYCDRLTRKQQADLISLEIVAEVPSDRQNPLEKIEETEMRKRIHNTSFARSRAGSHHAFLPQRSITQRNCNFS